MNESGVSIYSITGEAEAELPNMDPNLRSAGSILCVLWKGYYINGFWRILSRKYFYKKICFQNAFYLYNALKDYVHGAEGSKNIIMAI